MYGNYASWVKICAWLADFTTTAGSPYKKENRNVWRTLDA